MTTDSTTAAGAASTTERPLRALVVTYVFPPVGGNT